MEELKKIPKVLVVSHNAFSETNNMGRSMKDMLGIVPAECLAQLYFHTETPSVDNCRRYYRITDVDMFKSFFTRKSKYTIFNEVIQSNRQDSKKSFVKNIYQYARKRTPLIYFLRNLLWEVGKWESSALDEWIKEFCPDVIFFASGDYKFAYKVVCTIAEKYNLPIVTWCCDDYYVSKKDNCSALYKHNKRQLLKWLFKVLDRTKKVIVISDMMKTEYEKFIKKPIEVLRISADENIYKESFENRKDIVYMGNLGINRVTPLLELARALKKEGIDGLNYITVYSGDKNPETLNKLTLENGIKFKGFVQQDQIPGILGRSKYVVHTEAFDENSKLRTKFSLSTKIGDCLQSGACIVAFGPSDISSMSYLQNNKAAICSKKIDDIIFYIKETMNNKMLYENYVNRAYDLAEKCHNQKYNDEKVAEILFDSVNKK